MIIDIIVSFLCAVSASLGIGGGGLLVVYLTSFKDISQRDAQGINLLFFVTTMSVALIYHKFKRRIITKNILYILPPCISGGILGSLLAKNMDQKILKVLFGAFLVFCGISYLMREIGSKKGKNNKNGLYSPYALQPYLII